MFILEIRTL